MLPFGRRLLQGRRFVSASAAGGLQPSIPVALHRVAASPVRRGFVRAGAGGGNGGDHPDKYAKAPDTIGTFKSPVVAALWSRRGAARELEGENPTPPIERKPSDSRQSITYNFSTVRAIYAL
jgi:hypothetical protein